MTVEIPSIKATLSKYVKKPSEATVPRLIAIYGNPGSGKSFLAGSASELDHVKSLLFIDTEGSSDGTLVGFDDNKIEILNIPETVQALNAERAPGEQITNIQFFDKVLNDLFSVPDSGYDAIVIDTLDVAQDWKSKELVGIWEKVNKYKVWELLGDWSTHIADKLKANKALGIVVLHTKEDKDESTGAILQNIRFKGAAKDTFPGIPDVVGYTTRRIYKVDGEEKEITVIEFATQDGKVTKNRFQFPSKMIEPSIKKLWDHAVARAAAAASSPKTKETK